jgi:hypothetical protein
MELQMVLEKELGTELLVEIGDIVGAYIVMDNVECIVEDSRDRIAVDSSVCAGAENGAQDIALFHYIILRLHMKRQRDIDHNCKTSCFLLKNYYVSIVCRSL